MLGPCEDRLAGIGSITPVGGAWPAPGAGCATSVGALQGGSIDFGTRGSGQPTVRVRLAGECTPADRTCSVFENIEEPQNVRNYANSERTFWGTVTFGNTDLIVRIVKSADGTTKGYLYPAGPLLVADRLE